MNDVLAVIVAWGGFYLICLTLWEGYCSKKMKRVYTYRIFTGALLLIGGITSYVVL